jgi:hypothetical protein
MSGSGALATLYMDLIVRDEQLAGATEKADAYFTHLQKQSEKVAFGMDVMSGTRTSAISNNAGGSEWESRGIDSQLAAWQALRNAQSLTTDQMDKAAVSSNVLHNNLLRANTVVMLFGRTMGLTSTQIYGANIAMQALGGRSNLLTGGWNGLKESATGLLTKIISMNPVTLAAAAAVTVFAGV